MSEYTGRNLYHTFHKSYEETTGGYPLIYRGEPPREGGILTISVEHTHCSYFFAILPDYKVESIFVPSHYEAFCARFPGEWPQMYGQLNPLVCTWFEGENAERGWHWDLNSLELIYGRWTRRIERWDDLSADERRGRMETDRARILSHLRR
jgi:hypothetical protein